MLSFFSHQRSKQQQFVRPALMGAFLALMLFVSACGGDATPTNAPTTGGASGTTPTAPKASIAPPTDLVVPGTLTVGSDTTYPPQEFIDAQTQKPVGFDVDLITAMAEHMGLKADVQTIKFDALTPGLKAKRFDLVISALTINDDRKKDMDFITYFKAGESLLVQKGNPHNLKSVDDLCGQAVGVQDGTVEQGDLKIASDVCTKAGKPAINVTVLQDQTAVIQLLASNRVVATYQDSPVTTYYLTLHPNQFEVGGAVVNAADEGIAVRKGDTAMQTAIQAAFDAVKADGTYTNLINKWKLTDEAITSIDRQIYGA